MFFSLKTFSNASALLFILSDTKKTASFGLKSGSKIGNNEGAA